MIGFILPILLQGAAAPPPVEDRLMVCRLRAATLSDPAAPTKLVPEGSHRLLIFRMKGPVTGDIAGSAVEMHDPTGIMLGRSVGTIVQNNGTTGILMRGGKRDGISLVVGPAQPGRASGDAYLNRLKNGRAAGFAVGGCGFYPSRDVEADFKELKAVPGIQP